MSIQPASSEPNSPKKGPEDKPRRRIFGEGNKAFTKYLGHVEIHPEYWSLFELLAFIGGAVGGGLIAYNRYRHIGSPVPVAASLTGLVIGALIAGMAIMARCHDPAFLKTLDRHGGSPASKYFSPFITTATVGVVAILAIISYTLLPVGASPVCRAAVGAAAGGLTLLTLAGLTGALGTLITYLDVYEYAALDED
ncbi:hypothetical protein [Streptomyces luteogriseus]|uniref:hypothetical protein n=1 Tax=Streptomyces luteogriseus TaxID=68233 RepID=UPI0037BC0BFE